MSTDNREGIPGEIKLFRPAGYGFLIDLMDPAESEYFFHITDVNESLEEADLEAGLKVVFDLIPSHKRPGELQAVNVARA